MPFIGSVRGSYGSQGRFGARRGIGVGSTGGTITTAGGYRIHTFTSNGTFVPDGSGNVEILLVGGGGGAGNYSGGGGGGEVVVVSRAIGTESFPIVVGAGGNPSTISTYDWQDYLHGQASTGFSETAKPGGGGKSADMRNTNGATLSSGTPPDNGVDTRVANGGGGGSRSAGYAGQVGSSVGSGVTRFGGFRGGQASFDGGSPNQSPNHPGGGGGGAGASVTGDSGPTNSTPGGIGVQSSILGTNYYWGGGGGGGNHPLAGSGGNGGLGGGGGGAASSSGGGSALNTGGNPSGNFGGTGGANTGGGAGGNGGSPTSGASRGGSGIVVVRYTV